MSDPNLSDPLASRSQPSSSSMPKKSMPKKREGRLIRTVLSPALKLWLRSQVETVDHLAVEIAGSDRQILSGQIPAVTVAATAAVYQGLHLSSLDLQGQNIRINLGQVMRGKPLRLLEPIWITAQLQLSEADLNASLRSPLLAPLLAPALKAIAIWLASESGTPQGNLENLQLSLAEAALQLQADWVSQEIIQGVSQGASRGQQPSRLPVRLGAQVLLEEDQLSLTHLKWLESPPAGLRADLSDCPFASIRLGEDVKLEAFAIAAGQIHCSGQITVNP